MTKSIMDVNLCVFEKFFEKVERNVMSKGGVKAVHLKGAMKLLYNSSCQKMGGQHLYDVGETFVVALYSDHATLLSE